MACWILAVALAAISPHPLTMPHCSNHSDLSHFPKGQGGCGGVVQTAADWEARRADVLVGAQAVMGVLPPPGSKSALDVQIQTTVTTALYARHAISFVAEPDEGDRLAVRP